MADVTLLAAFGDPNWFRDAFNWDLNRIFQWLETTSQTAKDPVSQKYLQDTLSKIKIVALPDGKRFRDPRVGPNSHFARTFNEDWSDDRWDGHENERGRQISKFILNEWPNKFRRRRDGDAGIQVPYWNPYDLLGYFFNVLGPAPPAANKSNYFLPLTAVYARWCSKIAGTAPRGYNYPPVANPGAGTWPFMYQCTWWDDPGNPTKKWFFLGSSLGGDSWMENAVGTFNETVQRHRFDMFRTCSQIKIVKAGDYAQRTPEQRAGGHPNPYGACAEGYPFAEMLSSDKLKNRHLYGLSLKRDFMRNPALNQYDRTRNGGVWTNNAAPCRNCTVLLKRAGAQLEHFSETMDLPL
ncbi:uncharacterized protein GGS22DRAFT_151182 [Annulohypoxylon maeteangense]|uniref:uncharacterized protein n=1 Tax=Annulohypoxylon maeteangense TaxID=1927788 RepID=UPI002008D1FC|nr:uncharacterized protein GGS22DRAFT_151182 [Annulohypoxylon maeteangense]KAI0890539.1 hypothetical protein GGS22DRAFT_151182 [Annulohypoxylon maeteangense]